MSRVIAVNDPDKLVAAALAEARPPLEPLLQRDYTVELHTPAEFREQDYLLPNGDVALGHVHDRDTLWLNSAYAKRRPQRAKHVIRHEIFHAIIGGLLTAAKKAALLPLIRQRDGDIPPKWGGTYQDRPSEILADRLAAHVAGIESPFDDYYGDLPDPALALNVLLAPDPEPVEPEPPPEPLPPPPDPIIAVLEARVTDLTKTLREIGEKVEEKVG